MPRLVQLISITVRSRPYYRIRTARSQTPGQYDLSMGKWVT